MFFGFLVSLVFANLIFQGYVLVQVLQGVQNFFLFLGLDAKSALYLIQKHHIFLKIFVYSLVLPQFFITLAASIWVFQKKKEGRILLTIMASFWLISGILAWGEVSTRLFVWTEGLRGAIVLAALLLDATLGRRKKYLFAVKK